MRPKTSIELGINKAISTDLQLCLDLAQENKILLKNNGLKGLYPYHLSQWYELKE